MELFQSLGIYTKDKNGYVYPYSEQAASVREAFEAGVLSGTGVTFVPEAEVRTVSEKEGLFYIGVHLLSEENVQHKKEKYYRHFHSFETKRATYFCSNIYINANI